MKIRRSVNLIVITGAMTICGCGFGGFGGGGGSSSSSGGTTAVNETELNGVVSKGIFKNGTVRVYAVNSDGSETLLKTTSISAEGKYAVTISPQKTSPDGSYTGIVLIKGSGSYQDEATGSEAIIGENEPLRTLITNPSGNSYKAAVTPLTEIAARKALSSRSAGSQLTVRDVQDANALVSQMFKVDIIGTRPVGADLSSTGFGNAATTQAQKDYTLALAAISQMAKESGTLSGVLTGLESDMADGTLSVDTVTTFQTALRTFLASDKNLTGVQDINATNLVNPGGTLKLIKLGTNEKEGLSAIITGITVTVVLPPGVTIKADYSAPEKIVKPLLAGGVTSSGPGTLAGSRVEAAYIPASDTVPGSITVTLINPSGFMAGEFATLQCDMPVGSVFTSADFSIYHNSENQNDPRNFKAVDENGAKYPQERLTVQILPE